MVEALPELLPFLPPEQRERVYAEAEARGVPVLRGTRVERLERAAADGPITVTCSSADPLQADLVLVATGVRPNAEIAAEAGLESGRLRQHRGG